MAYTNDFEDAGSISLVVKPSKIRVVEVMPDTHMADRAKVAQEFADWFRDDPQGAEDYFGPDGMREIAGKIRERFPQVKLGASAITLPDGTPVEFRLEKNVPMVGVARGADAWLPWWTARRPGRSSTRRSPPCRPMSA